MYRKRERKSTEEKGDKRLGVVVVLSQKVLMLVPLEANKQKIDSTCSTQAGYFLNECSLFLT